MEDKNVISTDNLDGIIGGVTSNQAGVIMGILLCGMRSISINNHMSREYLQQEVTDCVNSIGDYVRLESINRPTICSTAHIVLLKLLKS